ncbi:MAG: hypothetical protein AAF206_26075, partial [Bacteroidota bacterium]
FSQEAFGKALDAVGQIRSHKGFQVLDEELRLFVTIFQIVNLYEDGQYKSAETQFKKLRKTYKTLLKEPFYAKAKKFLDIVMRLNRAAIEGKSVFLKSAYNHFVKDFPSSEVGDNQIIMYELYLAAKLEDDKTYYQMLCEAVDKIRA